MSITVKLARLATFGHPVACKMAWGSGGGIDREELRAAILDLVRIAALWEGGALERGHAETRAADERLLRTVVKAIAEHQRGARSVPFARVGKHVVRRIDVGLAQVHERITEVLRSVDGAIGDDELDQIRAAFRPLGIKGVTTRALRTTIERLQEQSGTRHWVHELRGPEMAAAELMSAVVPRSGRYVFLVKQALDALTDQLPEEEKAAGHPVDLELEARGRLPTKRALTEYMLRLLSYSPRTIRRVMDVLHGVRAAKRTRA
ncbi:MAG: hypothetical protein HYZ28_13555 [Myxococcales bacterium]|nr:hypothetical protein [Myxococcales bacterium]